MTQINPKEVLKENIIYNVLNEKVQLQQVGIDLTIKNEVRLKHGTSCNVEFNEKFNMKNCFGVFYVRSSFSRKGVFVTSGVYDPGFNGTGGCTIYNMSGEDVIVDKNTRVGQMIVFKANKASDYNGYYNNGGIDSKFENDKD
jgi:deoxycytidine triphosphate deaminase